MKEIKSIGGFPFPLIREGPGSRPGPYSHTFVVECPFTGAIELLVEYLGWVMIDGVKRYVTEISTSVPRGTATIQAGDHIGVKVSAETAPDYNEWLAKRRPH